MSNMTIDEADEDLEVEGNEYIPASDGRAPKKIKVGKIADFVISSILGASEASSTSGASFFVRLVDQDTNEPYLRRIAINDVIAAAEAALFGEAAADITASSKIVFKIGNNVRTVSYADFCAGAQAVVGASSTALSSADLVVLVQSVAGEPTAGKVNLGSVRDFALLGLAAYLGNVSAASPGNGDFFYFGDGSSIKKISLANMKSAFGDVTGPAETASGYVPTWDSGTRKLTGGMEVATSVSATPTGSKLVTEAAVRAAITAAAPDLSRVPSRPESPSSGNVPKWNMQGNLEDGYGVSTSIPSAVADASNSKLPTEKAVRSAISNALFGYATTEAVSTAISSAVRNFISSSNLSDALDDLDVLRRPATATENGIPQWDAVNGVKGGLGLRTSDSGITTDPAAASDLHVPTEKAVSVAVGELRAALAAKKLDELAAPSAGSTALDATDTRHGLMSAADKAKLDTLEDTGNAADLSGDIADGDLVLLRDVSLQTASKTRKTTFEKVWDFIRAHIVSGVRIDELLACADNVAGDATTSAHGLLPKLAGGTDKYLRADGNWVQPPGTTPFGGADASTAGTPGIVPAPAAGQQGRFLKADGTWADPPIQTGSEHVDIDALTPAESVDDGALFLVYMNGVYRKIAMADFAHRWDTIWVPAGAMAPGAGNPAYADNVPSSGNSTVRDAMRFGAVLDSFCDFALVLPDDFDPDAGVKAKVYWTTTGDAVSGTWVRFTLASLWTGNGGYLSNSINAVSDLDDQVLEASAQALHITPPITIVPSGTYGKGASLHFRLGRSYANYSPSGATRCTESVYVLGVLVRFRRKADGISANPSQQEAW